MHSLGTFPLSDTNIYLYQENVNSLSLNWCSTRDLRTNLRLLTPAQQHLFRIMEVKRKEFPDRFRRGNYFQNAYPIIACESPFATRFVCCGNKTSWNGSGSCQKWRFCSRCAFARQMAAVKTYVSQFHAGEFAFATIAFEGAVSIDITSTFATILDYWNAIDRSVKFLKMEGLILGAYFVEELSITSLLPLTVLPHNHAIFHLNPFAGYDSSHIQTALSTFLQDFAGEQGFLALTPSVRVKEVTTEEDFFRYFKYCTKAVDLRRPYKSAMRAAGKNNLEKRSIMNTELREFLHGWVSITRGRYAIRKIGTMHHASNDYIGVAS